MRAHLLADVPARRTWLLAFDKGDDVLPTLLKFAEEEKIVAAELRGIGGFREVTLAYFERATLTYEPLPVREQVEVVSLLGNITLAEGKPKVHAHCVIGRKDGSTVGGHLLAGEVWPTLELFVTAYAEEVERKNDPETKLPLL
ncbi:MAG TPA: PPC domain-containing DNA-binding protein [Terriglobales bacterium]|jgi:predicted DNA-binding protein with PD1-like motif|nr:PPC domain-containing DNA-binding protein [Terriglobales bacterium]